MGENLFIRGSDFLRKEWSWSSRLFVFLSIIVILAGCTTEDENKQDNTESIDHSENNTNFPDIEIDDDINTQIVETILGYLETENKLNKFFVSPSEGGINKTSYQQIKSLKMDPDNRGDEVAKEYDFFDEVKLITLVYENDSNVHFVMAKVNNKWKIYRLQ